MKAEITPEKAKVNYAAIGTWLEPYIGYEFEIKKAGKTVLWFYMDNGKPEPDVKSMILNASTCLRLGET